MWKSIATSVILAAVLPAQSQWHKIELSEPHMGTLFRMTVYAEDEAAVRTAGALAFGRAAELDNALSDYKPDSELNRLSRTTLRPVQVSADLFEVLRYSLLIAERTNGAFDITLGPLTHLWRASRRDRKLPGQDAIREARSHTGYKKVRLDERSRTVTLLASGMQLDLGGIAKGYAADQMFAILAAHGFRRALVAASGDIRAGDPPPDQASWRVALNPEDPRTQVVDLNNQAVSTAGPAEQFLEIGGKRYSHIVDPHSGFGMTDSRSVSVIAPTGLEADGWDTALCILGRKGDAVFRRTVPAGRAIFFDGLTPNK